MRTLYTIFLISLVFFAVSCKKDYLDAKPSSTLVVPTTLDDFQAMLNNNDQFNLDQSILGELSCDDFFYSQTTFNSLSPLEQNTYIWATDVFNGNVSVGDWDIPYEDILLTNLVLEGSAKISPTLAEKASFNNVQGTAYFFRGWSFFELVGEFSPTYDSSTASTDLGVPLKLGSDVNQRVARATVSDTYTQILSDLKKSVGLLPTAPWDNNLYLPSRGAAYGILSRVYLSMRDYTDALTAADSALYYYNALINYNDLDSATRYPIGYPNVELFFDYNLTNYLGINRQSYVDSTIYNSYAANDLRKKFFYKPFSGMGHGFRGFYFFGAEMEGGLCSDEMYLTRAECYARAGNTTNAMADLNTLMKMRVDSNSFVPYTATSSGDALIQILQERRKELVFRGIRWNDLRRLNKENQFATTLTRNINGQIYTLPPNDPRYVFPIPQDELLYNPVTQNQR